MVIHIQLYMMKDMVNKKNNVSVPCVSVIVPMYNVEQYLSACLDSLIQQTWSNIEIICVNDGSPDNSVAIVREYMQRDERIRLIEQENGGLSAARNSGLDQAKGKYIQFLDADDILLLGKIEKQVAFLEQTQADVCVCHHSMFTDSPDNIWENEFSSSTFDLTKEGFLYNWGKTFVIAIHAGLFRMDFLHKYNLFFEERVRALEDWLFWTNLVYHGAKFCELPDKLALYRVHESSMTKDKSYMQRNRVLAFLRMYEFLPEEDKQEFLQRGTDNLVQFFAKSNRNKVAEQKADSIDYKFGSIVLKPFHKLSSLLKRIYRKI